MAVVFGVTWDSIAQIPANSKLSKKRPDFQGFCGLDKYLFEAKGTTTLATVQKVLTKAIDQVKNYPEHSKAKIAIVSYLSADERFFPSSSFVVDPPAIPDGIDPTVETSRLLHFEKVLQFSGCPDTAHRYTTALSGLLKDRFRSPDTTIEVSRRLHFREQSDLEARFRSERERLTRIRSNRGNEIVGRAIKDHGSQALFFGASEEALRRGLAFDPVSVPLEESISSTESSESSFPDGTFLQIASQ